MLELEIIEDRLKVFERYRAYPMCWVCKDDISSCWPHKNRVKMHSSGRDGAVRPPRWEALTMSAEISAGEVTWKDKGPKDDND